MSETHLAASISIFARTRGTSSLPLHSLLSSSTSLPRFAVLLFNSFVSAAAVLGSS